MELMRNKFLKSVVALIFCTSLCMVSVSNTKANSCNHDQVLADCVATATQNYRDGTIKTQLYYQFTNQYCPAAAAGCLE